MCPSCRSLVSHWEQLSGRGHVWSFVISHPPLLPAYSAVAPYNVIVVALDEDPALRLVGNLVAGPDAPLNSIDPATIAIGEPVEVVFDAARNGIAMPRWQRSAP
jgi:uncharacterized OB-fold protein